MDVRRGSNSPYIQRLQWLIKLQQLDKKQLSQIVKKVSWGIRIICKKKICHFSKLSKAGTRMYQNSAKAFLSGDHIADDVDRESDDRESAKDEETVHILRPTLLSHLP